MTVLAPTSTEQEQPNAFRVAQRVIFPPDGDIDALPLYLDRDDARSQTPLHPDDILDRTSVLVRGGQRLSFGSYFNAFAAGYWRRWTVVETVRLTVRTAGPGTVLVYRSNARGNQQRVHHVEVSGEATSTFNLSLTTFGDGGWYWFDIVAGRENIAMVGADWTVPDDGRPHGRVSLGVTTFNRPDYCVRTIGMVAADDGLRSVLDEMIIIDQGTQKVRDDEAFPAAAVALGSQLSMLDQENLGGSGGFSRAMYETVKRGRSDYVLLLDDDIILEPESISRLVTFADLCRTPTIVGGHMFDINNRAILHTFGEVVNPFYWQPTVTGPGQYLGHDFSRGGLRDAAWMHQRVDVDYNGWWMCLIPVDVIRQLGLSLPIFIKWDDSEYGLRAKEAGIPTVSLPGSAVWHMSWIDKDDLVGWQAYFHARNRLITALLYSPFSRGKNMLLTAYALDLKHLVSMQYFTGTGRIMALEDVLRGPEHLHDILPKRLPEIRALAKGFSDAQIKANIDAFPSVRRQKPVKQKTFDRPTRLTKLVSLGLSTIARQVLAPVDPGALQHPQVQVAHKDNRWYRIAKNDSALVSTADGAGASWYIRDRRTLTGLARRSSALHGQVLADWASLRKRYRAARDDICSFDAWEQTFGLRPDERDRPERAQ